MAATDGVGDNEVIKIKRDFIYTVAEIGGCMQSPVCLAVASRWTQHAPLYPEAPPLSTRPNHCLSSVVLDVIIAFTFTWINK